PRLDENDAGPLRRLGKERRAAVAAKAARNKAAAVAGLGEALGRAFDDPERVCTNADADAEGAARDPAAISAMAITGSTDVAVIGVTHSAAEAAACDRM